MTTKEAGKDFVISAVIALLVSATLEDLAHLLLKLLLPSRDLLDVISVLLRKLG